MKTTVGLLCICVCVMLGGTAVAADQDQVPDILASLSQSESVIVLDDQHLGQIEGTFFLGGSHPGLISSICGFLKDPCGTIGLHLRAPLPGHPSVCDSITGFLRAPLRTYWLHKMAMRNGAN
ncbi:MAG: hypothetical protein R6V46_10135 [Desulfatiglandaceae bacterium]